MAANNLTVETSGGPTRLPLTDTAGGGGAGRLPAGSAEPVSGG